MKNLLFISILLIGSLISNAQSYLGFSSGYYNPILKIHQPQPTHITTSSIDASSKSSFYISSHIKERINPIFNPGVVLTYKNQRLTYKSNSAGGAYTQGYRNTSTDYINHYLNLQLNFEFAINEGPVYIDFGPSVDLLIYSKKHEIGSSSSTTYTSFNPVVIASSESDEWDVKESNKDAKGTIVSIFSGITFEHKLTENKLLFIRSQINYNFSDTYEGVKTLDWTIGVGIQFFLPNFNLLRE